MTADGHDDWADRRRSLRSAVTELSHRNRQTGWAPWCERHYDFVCPSFGTYPFQWFWDSCFHAIALSHLDTERAERELTSLMANQHDDGFISHVTFWQREQYEKMLSTYAIAYRTPWLSNSMQPPVLAEAVASVADRGRGDAFVAEVVDSVRRFYDWCDAARDPDGDGLIAVLQPDETGLDHSPKFDAYLGVHSEEHADFTAAWHRVADPYDEHDRALDVMFSLDRFIVEDVMVNTIYAENLRVLASLLERSGGAAAAGVYRRRADQTVSTMLSRCWDPDRGLFFDLAGADEHWLTANTVTSLFPLLLPELSAEMVRRLVTQLRDAARYDAAFPVPSVARDEPSYRPGVVGGSLVWRGPTWLNANWYLARGLLRHGHRELAVHLVDRSVALIERSGFREYYNPETGEGHGAHDFGWSAIALDMLELVAPSSQQE
ncbi:MAG: amylo-alpha-1,6-glucosidase [Egibacteraceae bacterium]